ncbi:hypothetical protein [Nocardia sp. NPDC020380]|uniref:hypothetical protein n=1 Tax=Nocardia sp. NPDC020380 TaxID=3364309 RepID=UPI0037BDE11C
MPTTLHPKHRWWCDEYIYRQDPLPLCRASVMIQGVCLIFSGHLVIAKPSAGCEHFGLFVGAEYTDLIDAQVPLQSVHPSAAVVHIDLGDQFCSAMLREIHYDGGAFLRQISCVGVVLPSSLPSRTKHCSLY